MIQKLRELESPLPPSLPPLPAVRASSRGSEHLVALTKEVVSSVDAVFRFRRVGSSLEKAIGNYSCLSAGDIIEIAYQSLTFRLLIMEITPPGPAISVLDTDLEVDFAPPVGYVEPEYKPRGADLPTLAEKLGIDTKRVQEVDGKGSGTSTPVPARSSSSSIADAKGKGKEAAAADVTDETGGAARAAFEAFRGSGNSLGGKRVKGKGVKAKAIEQVDQGSRIIRTE